MIGQILLNTTFSMPLSLMTLGTSYRPAKDVYENIFFHPSQNMTAIIFLAVGLVALVLLAVYAVKKVCERNAARRASPPP